MKRIINLVKPIIESNLELLEQYNERPERVTKTIMGQLMKVTNGNKSWKRNWNYY